jgi:hypothetical protein
MYLNDDLIARRKNDLTNCVASKDACRVEHTCPILQKAERVKKKRRAAATQRWRIMVLRYNPLKRIHPDALPERGRS